MMLPDKHIVISGGNGNIGSYFAERALEAGYVVSVIDLGNDQIKQFREIRFYRCDLTDYNQAETCVQQIYKDNGVVDVLINNAGYICNSPLVNLMDKDHPKHTQELWSKGISSNLTTTFNLTVHVAEQMVRKRNKGLILNMGSISANGNIGQSAYSAAKAGINALTVTWSKELSIFGIRCNAIAPGFIDTPSTHEALSDTMIAKWKKAVPLARLGSLKELWAAVQFLIENEYVNGQVVAVDGGLRI